MDERTSPVASSARPESSGEVRGTVTREASPRGEGRIDGLDGLRAIAVALVVLFHLRVPGFEAGFLGVDVFFVISGFLITTLMVREVRRTGRLSLPGFWARRVRRLMPGLAILLAVVAVVGAALAAGSELETLRGDLVATALYVANWHYIGQDSYFSFTGYESPLQHAWSLAVEEQFYLAWPLAVAALLVVFRRSLRVLGAFTLLGVAVSAFLLFAWWSPGSADRAYMGTLPRMFEPMLGAAGALLLFHGRTRAVLARWGRPIAVGGAIALVIGVASISPTGASYYRGGALGVSLASLAIVIAVWLERAGSVGWALSLRPLVWLGAISYGVYLWHWPLTLWFHALEPGDERVLRGLAVVVATVGLAAISYHVVERPIRAYGRADARVTTRTATRTTLVAVPVVMTAVIGVSLVATRVPAAPPGAPRLVLLGDSVPLRLAAPFERAAERIGWDVDSAAFGGCSVIGDAPIGPDGSEMSGTYRCAPEVETSQQQLIEEIHPDVVVWWDRVSVASVLLPSGERIASGTPAFWEFRQETLRHTVDRLGGTGATVVFVGVEPPGSGIAQGCPEGGHGGCNEAWQRFLIDRYDDVTTAWNDMMRRYAQQHPDRAAFISLTAVVCADDEAPCDDGIDGVPARPDGQHYEGAGERAAIDALIDALTPIVEAR